MAVTVSNNTIEFTNDTLAALANASAAIEEKKTNLRIIAPLAGGFRRKPIPPGLGFGS